MSHIHGSPTLHLRRESGYGDASPDAINIDDLAASRAAWKRSGGRFIVVAGEHRYNPHGWPEPVKPGLGKKVCVSRERRQAIQAEWVRQIEKATAKPYSRPPTTRGHQWFVVFNYDSKRVRYPLKTPDAVLAVEAGLVVTLEMGRVSMDERGKQ